MSAPEQKGIVMALQCTIHAGCPVQFSGEIKPTPLIRGSPKRTSMTASRIVFIATGHDHRHGGSAASVVSDYLDGSLPKTPWVHRPHVMMGRRLFRQPNIHQDLS